MENKTFVSSSISNSIQLKITYHLKKFKIKTNWLLNEILKGAKGGNKVNVSGKSSDVP